MQSPRALPDLFPLFFEHVPSWRRERFEEILHVRHAALITRWAHLIAGRRVLDLACGGGGYSYAAIAVGARHVTGVDAGGTLLEQAGRNMRAQGVAPERYCFRQGDLHETLPQLDAAFETIFCFGYGHREMLHAPALRQFPGLSAYRRLFEQMATLRPQALIGDLSCPQAEAAAVGRLLETSVAPLRIDYFDWTAGSPSLQAQRYRPDLARISFAAILAPSSPA